MYYFLFLLLWYTVKGHDFTPEAFKNHLHFGYGINFKFNGQLHHNLDRVWVVHRVTLPTVRDIDKVPPVPDPPECPPKSNFVRHNAQTLEKKNVITDLCKLAQPYFKLINKQAMHHRQQVHRMIIEDLYHALHELAPVSYIPIQRRYPTKRALYPPTVETINKTSPLKDKIPRSRSKRFSWAMVGSMALPALKSIAALAVENLGSWLQRKRNRALQTAINELDQKQLLTRNHMHQLAEDFLLYGDYDVSSSESILNMFSQIQNKTSVLESWLRGHDKIMAKAYITTDSGPVVYSHQLQLYLSSLREKYVKLFDTLVEEIELLLRGVAVLSRGYLPPQLFPPSVLANISETAIAMVKTTHQDYTLALSHVTDYYDMRMVTFGRDDQGRLIVCFPIFIKEYKKEAMTLYQIETVKVPIIDQNKEADSYSEVMISKPYIASNKDYYIQLVVPELVMCKKIRHIYYCEELFLVKHKTKHSCESAIFYNLPKEAVQSNCQFRYDYNITVPPSVLDGGSQVVLANMLKDKRLICSYEQGLAKPLPSSPYVRVSREIFCHCHLQVGLTYILKTITACNTTKFPVLDYTVNLAFLDYFTSFWNDSTIKHIPPTITTQETILPVNLTDFNQDKFFYLYGNNNNPTPTTLKELSQLIYHRKLFLESRKKLSYNAKAEIENQSHKEKSENFPKKDSFLYSFILHIYLFIGSTISVILILPHIIQCIKHKKLRSLVTAVSLYQQSSNLAVEAKPIPAPLTAVDIPTHNMTKLVCHDPWVSVIMTILTVVGIIVYMYRSCKHVTLMKGLRFACICHVHLVISNTTRYTTIKIGHYVGSPFSFHYSHKLTTDQITMQKEILWDHLHIKWGKLKIKYKDNLIMLRQHITVPLVDKVRLRTIMSKPYNTMFMVRQGDTWYNLSQMDTKTKA